MENPARIAKGQRFGNSDFVDLLVFLIPCVRFIQVKIVGVLSGTDLLVFAIFLYLILRWRVRIESTVGKWLIVLSSFWLVSQCVTDIVRRSAFTDYARGWSNIGMTIAYLTVLWTLLCGHPRRIILYGWGLVIGTFLTVLITPNELMQDDPWKFGYSLPVTLAVFLLASRKDIRGLWPFALGAAIGVLDIALGVRSEGGVSLGAALYLLATHLMRKGGTEKRKLKASSMLLAAVSMVIAFAGILWGYQYVASNGILGEDARFKYELQSGGQYGILLGGRVEMLGYLPAIYDSPILGHGSWARDPTYLLIEQQTLALMGYSMADDIPKDAFKEGLIPTHSYLFGAWVDAGILGAIFWGWAGLMTIRTLMQVHPASDVLLPLMAFTALTLLWDILFSPYGAEMRIISPYYVVLLLTQWHTSPRKVTKPVLHVARQKYLQASS